MWTWLLALVKDKLGGKELTYLFLGIGAVILLVFILPNLDQIKERFGFESRASLKVVINEQKTSIDKAVDANKELQDGLFIQSEKSKATGAAFENVRKDEVEREVFAEKLKKERVDRPKTIKADPKLASIDSEALSDIEMVWDSYNFVKGQK